MVSRSGIISGAGSSAGVDPEIIRVILEFDDRFSDRIKRASATMDPAMRKIESTLDRYDNHYQRLVKHVGQAEAAQHALIAVQKENARTLTQYESALLRSRKMVSDNDLFDSRRIRASAQQIRDTVKEYVNLSDGAKKTSDQLVAVQRRLSNVNSILEKNRNVVRAIGNLPDMHKVPGVAQAAQAQPQRQIARPAGTVTAGRLSAQPHAFVDLETSDWPWLC